MARELEKAHVDLSDLSDILNFVVQNAGVYALQGSEIALKKEQEN